MQANWSGEVVSMSAIKILHQRVILAESNVDEFVPNAEPAADVHGL
jgi:hypothetical protein